MGLLLVSQKNFNIFIQRRRESCGRFFTKQFAEYINKIPPSNLHYYTVIIVREIVTGLVG